MFSFFHPTSNHFLEYVRLFCCSSILCKKNWLGADESKNWAKINKISYLCRFLHLQKLKKSSIFGQFRLVSLWNNNIDVEIS